MVTKFVDAIYSTPGIVIISIIIFALCIRFGQLITRK